MSQIDEAIRNKAAGLGVSVKDLLAVAQRQGFSEQDYRDEVLPPAISRSAASAAARASSGVRVA